MTDAEVSHPPKSPLGTCLTVLSAVSIPWCLVRWLKRSGGHSKAFRGLSIKACPEFDQDETCERKLRL
jgi:hypothetical protein